MIVERIVAGSLETNCYVLGSGKEAVVIDPGGDFEKIIAVVRKNGLTVKFVVNTHGHGDHIVANDNFGVPVLIHKDDAHFLSDPALNLSLFAGQPLILSSPYRALVDGDKVTVGEVTLEVIHTPGHTPGGICLKKEKDFIFTGDTLFCGGIGRTDFPYGSQKLLIRSIKERLLILNDEMIIYPGHGPFSTIGKEKEQNPFL